MNILGNIQELISYSSRVAAIQNGKLTIYPVNNWCSHTTLRHINEFIQQNGFKHMTKKELEEYIS